MWILGLEGLTPLGPKVACSRLQDSSAVDCGRFARKSIHLTAFAGTLVDSPDVIKHSTTW